VEELVFECDTSSKEVSDAGQWTDSVELWTGEFGERIKCQSVYCLRICELRFSFSRDILTYKSDSVSDSLA
jgi:hypothetical protein